MRRRLELVFAALVCCTFAAMAAAQNGNFRAHCQGASEVPPVESMGQCQAIFNQTDGGNGLQYKLIVANIESVTQAHIHLAPAGQNGGVVPSCSDSFRRAQQSTELWRRVF